MNEDIDTIAARWKLSELTEALYASLQKLHYLQVDRLTLCACIALDNKDLLMFQLILKEWTTLTPTQRRISGFMDDSFSKITLSYAVDTGNKVTVKLALENGVDPNHRPLVTRAASENDLLLVKMLLKHGASPNIVDCYGNTALQYALEYRNKSMLDDLIQHGAKAGFVPRQRASRHAYTLMSRRTRSLEDLEVLRDSIVQENSNYKQDQQNAKRRVAKRLGGQRIIKKKKKVWVEAKDRPYNEHGPRITFAWHRRQQK